MNGSLAMRVAFVCVLFALPSISRLEAQSVSERIGLNFIRPDVNRPGHYDFHHNTDWLLEQYTKLGVKWNRVAFSWNDIQPNLKTFNWSTYDKIISYCTKNNIQVVATLGGHFDQPRVPSWAGSDITDVIRNHPEHLQNFVKAWVERYKNQVTYWEIMNEPGHHHFDLNTIDYVDLILKPVSTLIRSIDKDAVIIACSTYQLPKDNREYFWANSSPYTDIYNIHNYSKWDAFRTQPTADEEVKDITNFRNDMLRHNITKPFWITEIGWWGSGCKYIDGDSTNSDVGYKKFKGEEILKSKLHLHEDSLRAIWLKDLFPKMMKIDGCEKVFLWCAMDEYEGGFNSKTEYYSVSANSKEDKHPLFDLWGIFDGNRKWKKSAYALKDILKNN